VLYLSGAFGGQDYCHHVESEWAVVYIVGCEEVAGCPDQFDLFGMCDGLFGRAEELIGSGFDLDEDQARVGIDHDEIDFAAVAGEIAGEGFESFCSQELFAAFFTPSAEGFYVGQESAAVEQHNIPRGPC